MKLIPFIAYSVKRLAGSLAIASVFLLTSCYQQPPAPDSVKDTDGESPLFNFQDKNFARFATTLRQLRQAQELASPSVQGASQPLPRQIHIIQLGDSHTAADFFSGRLRQRFQQDYGNAGVGLVPPGHIHGQRTATMHFSNTAGWRLLSSRKQDNGDFPPGGFISESVKPYSKLRLTLAEHETARQQLQLLYHSGANSQLFFRGNAAAPAVLRLPATQGQWRFSAPLSVRFPAEVTTDKQPLRIGGWFMRTARAGVMLSALGINGGTLDMTDKWQAQWTQLLAKLKPDLLILAYGTNEAFNDKLDLSQYRQRLTEKIRQLRQAMPQAVILLVGPPDSVKHKTASNCYQQQPSLLVSVIEIQRQVARHEHTLFWDWRGAMGGECAMIAWSRTGMAQADLIHFTRKGYELSADLLYDQLQDLLHNPPASHMPDTAIRR